MLLKIKKIVSKKNRSKIVCLTAYSKNIASILDNHCDIILVGDSLGSVLYNYSTTRKVTLNTMIEHSRSVKKGIKKSLMVVDMPYKTYRNPKEALTILRKLNGQKHQLISSVCISKNGSMIWNSTDASTLTMKQLNSGEIKSYLEKIKDKELYAYGVYQIEADGRSLFSKIEGDEYTIMGLPVKQIKEYLNSIK